MHKVLVLTSTFPRWENDTEPPFVFELCKQLAESFDVYVLTPHAPGALHNEILNKIKVFRFRYFFESHETLCYQGGILARLRENAWRYLLIPFFMLSQLIAAYRLIKHENIYLIHAHWIIPQGLIACILRLFFRHPIRVLCTSHGGDLFSLTGNVANIIKRLVLINSQAVSVVNSVMVKKVYSICKPFNPIVSVIPMGVDFENKFLPSLVAKKPFSLIVVGRLVEKKGIHYLIYALPLILKIFPQVHLSIIGNGPMLGELNELVDQLRLRYCVDFLGSVSNDELPIHYQAHQIAVFPFIVAENGDREGLPVVIPEAIGCGCCIVTTDLPGVEDVITHEHNGLMVKQKSSLSIAEAIIELFSNPDKINQYSLIAYDEVLAKFDSKIVGNKYTVLIESMLESA